MNIQIYIDGACKGNPGPGGWGAILRCNGTEKELYGGEANTTNNRMEMTAVIRALAALKRRLSGTIYKHNTSPHNPASISIAGFFIP